MSKHTYWLIINKHNKSEVEYIYQFDIRNETIHDKDKSKMACKVISILKDIKNSQISRKYIENDDWNILIISKRNKSSGDKYNLTAYGYLLT